MSGTYKTSWLCETLLVSRSGYYDWQRRRREPGPRQVQNLHLRERIRTVFAESRCTYCSPRIAHLLRGQASRNRVARLMRIERLWARQRSKYRPIPLTAAMPIPSPQIDCKACRSCSRIKSGSPMSPM